MHRDRIWAAILGTFIVGLGAAMSVETAPRQWDALNSTLVAAPFRLRVITAL
jgi:hypothetical protein